MSQLEALDIHGPPVTYLSSTETSLTETVSRCCMDERYDFAVLCLPDHLHFEGLSALLARAVPTLIVKPLVATTAEADALVSNQEVCGAYCAVEFHKRWDQSNLYAKRMINEGKLGQISYIGVDYSQRITIPTETFCDWTTRTNIFQYLGVHYVDLIYFLTNAAPVRLSAYGTKGVLQKRGYATYDSIHCAIEWKNADASSPFLSTLNIGWIDPDTSTALSNQRIYLVGSRGRIDCDQKHRGVELVEYGKPATQVNPYFSQVLPAITGNRYSGYALDSVECFISDLVNLRNGVVSLRELHQSDRPTLAAARISTAVIEAAMISIENANSWTTINAFSRP
jgi:predicted dehydrogenase